MWIKVFAMWPFMARCKNCGCKVRLKIPRWQNILFQILGQLAFWSILLAGLTAGGGNCDSPWNICGTRSNPVTD